MPIPKPTESESESEYVSRCIRKIIDEYDQSQAAAICYATYRQSYQEMSKEKLFVLQPKKTENRGTYLSRCSNHPKIKSQMKNMKERMSFCLNCFNEYYRYWSKLEDFAEVPKESALGQCIAREKAKGFDYREAYAHCASKVVVQPQGGTNPQVMNDDLIVEPVAFQEMDILGYKTKYFYICPGAQATFEHLISMMPDEETAGMIRSAALIADKVFEIEANAIDKKEASLDDLNLAKLLVGDFYDIIEEINEETGMEHDVSYMEGHIEKIAGLVKEKMGLEDACWEGYEAIGTKIVNGREVPNCVPIKEDK